jgi:hypothetical protein
MSKEPEPIILAVALLLLALGAGGLAYVFPSVEDSTGVKTTEPSGAGAVPLKADAIQASLAPLQSPDLWQEPTPPHRLFISEEYLFFPSAYPGGDYIKKNDPLQRAPSGVLLSWYRKNNLDFTDPNIDHEDPDNDGFSNIVEFRNEQVGERLKASDCDGTKSTDPRNAQDHPGYLSRMRLLKYDLRPFHIQFTGYQQLNGVYLFQLHLDDVPSYNQPQLKKTGDELGFEGYVIGAFHEQFSDVTDPTTHGVVHTDTSELILEKPEIGLKVTLPFRKIVNSPESTASFITLLPTEVDKVIKVSTGKVFTGPAPYLSDQSFLVINAGDNGSTIRDTKTNKEYHIPKLIPDEWNEVPGVAQQASTTTTSPNPVAPTAPNGYSSGGFVPGMTPGMAPASAPPGMAPGMIPGMPPTMPSGTRTINPPGTAPGTKPVVPR